MTAVTKNCTGCRACELRCPKHAIEMKTNEEGFSYAVVREADCIDCGLCKKICPQESKPQCSTNEQYKAYAAQNEDKDVLKRSSSGGMFPFFAQEVINSGGVVFGVQMNGTEEPTITKVESLQEIMTLQGSKYVSSNVGNSYIEVEKELKAGKKVLYCACPCQVAGCRSYLGKEYDNLLLVDVICHGTPSYKLFLTYIDYLEKKKESKVEQYFFRYKQKYGWGVYWHYSLKNGKKVDGGLHDDPYISAFINHTANREACYSCKYIGIENRSGDITLGDYWGIDRVHPEMASNEGVSAIIVNTLKGQNFCDTVLNKCKSVETRVEDIARYNPSLVQHALRPLKRDTVYKGIDQLSPFDFISSNLQLSTKEILKTKIRLMLPYSVRVMLKRVLK